MNNTGLILDAVSIKDLKESAVKAENTKFPSIWSTEFYRTSFQQISDAASVTNNVLLGTAPYHFIYKKSFNHSPNSYGYRRTIQ